MGGRSVWVQHDIGEETYQADTVRISTLGACSPEGGDQFAAAPTPRFIKTPGEISMFRAQRTSASITVPQTVTVAEGATAANDLGPTLTFAVGEIGTKLDDVNTGAYVDDDLASVKVASTGGTGNGSYRMFAGVFTADGPDTVTLCGTNASGNPTIGPNTVTYHCALGERRESTEAYTRTMVTVPCVWEHASVHVDLHTLDGDTTFRSRINGSYGNLLITCTAKENEARFIDPDGFDELSEGDFIVYEAATGAGDPGELISIEKTACELRTSNGESWCGIGGNYVTFGTSATTYAPWGGVVQMDATESNMQHALGMDCKSSRLGAEVSRTNNVNSQITITSRINGQDGNQSVTLTGVDSAIDPDGEDEVLATDLVSTEWVTVGGGGRVQSVVFRLKDANAGTALPMLLH